MGTARADEIVFALVGCGSFARFSMDVYRSIEGLRLSAVSDPRADLTDFDVAGYRDPGDAIGRPDVDLVYVATPPSSHFDICTMALNAGKHVLCEKPLAMNTRQSREILELARRKHRIAAVNFVLRHSAIVEFVKRAIDSRLFGAVLAAQFVNCAQDSTLGRDHWFWKKDISGGIFIEHGVHFFDLYRHWLGKSQVISAHLDRRNESQEDRALCAMRHEGGAIVTHYHGFDQPLVLDRAEHRLVCETGDIRVQGWVPTRMQMDGLVNERGLDVLSRLFTQCAVTDEPVAERQILSRGARRTVARRVRIAYRAPLNRQDVYRAMLKDLMRDQLAHLRDSEHERRVVEADGHAAVIVAEDARRLGERSWAHLMT